MNTCKGHSIQVSPGKLISLMFLNAFHWLLPWARLRSGLGWWSQLERDGEGLGYFSRTCSQGPNPSQAVTPKPIPKTVAVRFPVLGQNSITLTEQLHHHFRSSILNATTSSKLAQFLPPDREASLDKTLHTQIPTPAHPAEDKAQSRLGPVLCPVPGWTDGCPLSSSSSAATLAWCWAGAKDPCREPWQRPISRAHQLPHRAVQTQPRVQNQLHPDSSDHLQKKPKHGPAQASTCLCTGHHHFSIFKEKSNA